MFFWAKIIQNSDFKKIEHFNSKMPITQTSFPLPRIRSKVHVRQFVTFGHSLTFSTNQNIITGRKTVTLKSVTTKTPVSGVVHQSTPPRLALFIILHLQCLLYKNQTDLLAPCHMTNVLPSNKLVFTVLFRGFGRLEAIITNRIEHPKSFLRN